MLDRMRPALYLAVIVMASTLPYPMNIIQAAAGGIALGSWLFRVIKS